MSTKFPLAGIPEGQEAQGNETPFFVQLKMEITSSNGVLDETVEGGSLITERHILTAAHIVVRFKELGGKMSIRFRHSDYFISFNLQPKDVTIHPLFKPYVNEAGNDLAIVTLPIPYIFPGLVSTIPIHTNPSEYFDYAQVKVYGMGFFKNGGEWACPKRIRTCTLTVLPDICERFWKHRPDGVARFGKQAHICLFGFPMGTCYGDSGGPVILGDKLVGVVSWGYGNCDPRFPSVATRVANHVKWIIETTNQATLSTSLVLVSSFI